ncbi:hypothetical protein [Kitasatospora sp. NPDC059827]
MARWKPEALARRAAPRTLADLAAWLVALDHARGICDCPADR